MATKLKSTKKKAAGTAVPVKVRSSSQPKYIPPPPIPASPIISRDALRSSNPLTRGRPERPKNAFAGFISWLCMLAFIAVLPLLILLLISTIASPEAGQKIEQFVRVFPSFGELSSDIQSQIIAGGALILIAFMILLGFRRDRRAFEKCLTYAFSRLWVEVKILFAGVSVYIAYSVDSGFFTPPALITIFLLVYLVSIDLGHNGNIFRHNIVHSIISAVNYSTEKTTYERLARKRLVSSIIILFSIFAFGALLFSMIMLFVTSAAYAIAFMIIGGVFVLSGIIGTILWYSLNQRKDMRDLGEIMAQVEDMYNGNLSAVNSVPPTSNFYDMAMQLNMIRTGIEKAVTEGVKADMTKVELITNVSHDIRTPLTSIITYIDLIKKEPNLSSNVREYVDTIATKATRLNHIVQDVFEVSKAATGNIALDVEKIDIVTLLKQTLAEMEMTMESSHLQWKIDIPDTQLYIAADGQKLYRVFQNLIKNCTQYALQGSRAYLTLKQSFGSAEFSIRNISQAEIDPSAAESLSERFVRGDRNRTTEGTGLGLSIAKSFTEANGGRFDIKSDGDIFLVSVSFPIVAFAQPPALMPDAPPPESIPEDDIPVSEGLAQFEQKVEQIINSDKT